MDPASGAPSHQAWHILSAAQAELLSAIAERIFPTTDTPGAVAAGAVSYIDTALADAYRAALPRYRRALRELDGYARGAKGRRFVDLSPDEQDVLLTDLEAGRASGVTDGAAFFVMVRDHVLEGIFGDPQYGGNHDLIGWQLVGFPGQRTGYPDAYINRVVDLAPVAGWKDQS
jgi:hypothetical protein